MAVKPLILLPPAIFALVAGFFVAGMMRDDPDALPSTLEGREAPPVALSPLGEGAPFTDTDLRDGQVKLVNYWASWCGPCRIEHPTLMEVAASGVPVLGINYKDKPENALSFLAELGDPYAALGADDTGRTAIDWGVYGVPETYVIDGDGKVLLRFAGPVTDVVYRTRIAPALEAAEK